MRRVQIVKLRSSGFRVAHEVNDDGTILGREKTLTLKMPSRCLDASTVGSVWRVSGILAERHYRINGFEITEDLLTVESAKFERPSGELLVRWLARNIEGLGEVKAGRIVRAFPNLSATISNEGKAALERVAGISSDLANRIIEKWPSDGFYGVLEWLQDAGLPMKLADRLARVYEEQVIQKLETDPFILMSFGVQFTSILELAHKLGLSIPEDRILAAIAENSTNEYCRRTGSTVIPLENLLEGARKVAKTLRLDLSTLVESSLKHGTLLEVEGGFQGFGAAIQEATVARFLKLCVARSPGAGSTLAGWEKDLTAQKIEKALSRFESTLPFRMTNEQREAVINAVEFPVAAISGGAGTGKTTILLALLSVLDSLACGMAQFQVALSGRAARRMSESTGRPAKTIAKLIAEHVGEGKPPLPDHLVLVVDEASMVDLLSAYKLVGVLPYATRIVLVGDVCQLPPVGAGLVFHAVMRSSLSSIELTQPKRQADGSGLLRLATAIREGSFDSSLLSSETGDVLFVSGFSGEALLNECASGGDSKDCVVLTPVRRGPLGVDTVNKLIQSRFDLNSPPEVRYRDEFRGLIPWITPSGSRLRLGDQIMVIANDYDLDIRNGDLGSIVEVFEEPTDDVLGMVEIDGRVLPISTDLVSNLDLGFALTIHKSQGSQWHTCILLLPSYAERMIDQTLLYTAVTRPSSRLVVMGEEAVMDLAIKRGSIVSERITDLEGKLRKNQMSDRG